jgi:hypothetical protein
VISPFFGFGGFGFPGWGWGLGWGWGGYPYYPYYPYYAAPAAPYYSQPAYEDNTYVLPSQTTTSKYEVQPETQAPPANTAPASIVVVLKNGQRIEAPGSALVGSTLWVLDSQTATPYSISDIDIAATQAENHQRGVDIVIPSTQTTQPTQRTQPTR